jgi:hypothetical protein
MRCNLTPCIPNYFFDRGQQSQIDAVRIPVGFHGIEFASMRGVSEWFERVTVERRGECACEISCR